MNEFSNLIGRTITKIVVCRSWPFIYFYTNDRNYILHYRADNYSGCSIDDICGDMNDLIGVPVLRSSIEFSNNSTDVLDAWCNAEFWTFYKIETIKGYVTLRWTVWSKPAYGIEVNFDEHDDTLYMASDVGCKYISGEDLDLTKFETIIYGEEDVKSNGRIQ